MFTLKLLNSSIKCTRFTQRNISANSGRLNGFFKSEPKQEETSLDVIDSQDEVIDQEAEQARIDMLRNKSGLLPQHRNMVHGKVPYASAESWVHTTLKYQRKMYAKFGSKSNVDPSK
jgi:Growth arrest and DNA-damage-inducible proteins-interacting protein 1